jgi:hypothetical protein
VWKIASKPKRLKSWNYDARQMHKWIRMPTKFNKVWTLRILRDEVRPLLWSEFPGCMVDNM